MILFKVSIGKEPILMKMNWQKYCCKEFLEPEIIAKFSPQV